MATRPCTHYSDGNRHGSGHCRKWHFLHKSYRNACTSIIKHQTAYLDSNRWLLDRRFPLMKLIIYVGISIWCDAIGIFHWSLFKQRQIPATWRHWISFGQSFATVVFDVISLLQFPSMMLGIWLCDRHIFSSELWSVSEERQRKRDRTSNGNQFSSIYFLK